MTPFLTGTPREGGSAWQWPFQKPLKPDVPVVKDPSWVRNPIDAFILKRLEEKGLSPAAPASRRSLARRVYFDLIGMPPSPAEMKAYLDDESEDANERLVDRLLADPRYGECWGRHWLDVVRYAESNGLEGDVDIGNTWRYRDWVIQALNQDLPYDTFLVQQIAGGDEHSRTQLNYEPDVQGLIPAGFLRLGPWSFLDNPVADQNRQTYLDEVTTTTASVFLGLTLGCARCHDHKYDPISMKDYYRFQGFFSAIQIPYDWEQRKPTEKYVEVPFADKTFRERAASRVRMYQERLEQGPEKREFDDLERSLLNKLIAQMSAEAKDREPTIADLRLVFRDPGQKVFSPEETAMHARLSEAARRTGDPEEKDALDAYEKPLLKKLADAYARHQAEPLDRFKQLTGADVKAELGGESRKSKYFTKEELDRHRDLSDKLQILRRRLARWQPLAVTVLNAQGPPGGPPVPQVRILARGDYLHPGEPVDPGFPSAIIGSYAPARLEADRYNQFPTRGRRMTLAKWMASPENPLTARVMVNRIWQYHFGRGIVETANDFGSNGSRPTHPELLDWLALRLVEEHWSIKKIHKLILMSNTYRQSSDHPALAGNKIDPDNLLLWRFNRRRLTAEAVRDSVLFVSGRLNPERGGPSVFPPLPEDVADLGQSVPIGGLMWEPNEKEEDSRRRSVYIFQRRSLPLPLMASFDAPASTESCARRSATTTPLQALSLLNSTFVNEQAAHLAERVVNEAGPGRSAQALRLFEHVLNRPPEPDELQRLLKFQGSIGELCVILLRSNEFIYVD
jgi:hypothetical protein